MHLRPGPVALVAVGGATGTLLRFGLSRLLPWPGQGWPWATFTANVTGALLLGLILGALGLVGDASRRTAWQLVLGTGLLGGYTTYSTFAVETLSLGATSVVSAAAYALLSLLAGFLAALAGGRAGATLARRGAGAGR